MATAFSNSPFTKRRYTLDEFEQLFPEEEESWRFELLDGEVLVRPSPAFWHQELCARLLIALRSYTTPPRVGRVVSPGCFVVPPATALIPDVLVTPWTPLLLDWREMTEWLLAVEVLSPSTRGVDLRRKGPRYVQHGVKELWLVDPVAPRVTIARPGVADTLVEPPAMLAWQPWPPLAPLAIDLASLFADG